MKDKKYTIYKFTNQINGKSYIGLTFRDLEIRTHEHIYESKTSKNFKFHQAINKYGIDKFDRQILENNLETLKEANEYEIYYIELFDTYKNGYNMTKGGHNRENHSHSDKAKEKMRLSKLNIKHSKEHNDNISASLKNIPKTESHIANAAKALLGHNVTDETRLKISKNKKGKQIGAMNPSAIKINIYDANGNLKYQCNGNFEDVCKKNGLPIRVLRRSYYAGGKPIYANISTKKHFVKWYAIKL